MIRLSVNVNKVATLRNSRGGNLPDLLQATRACLAAGAGGITVHPRADARHITARDTREVCALWRSEAGADVEYNIEGDPRPDWLELVHELRPTQATLVPVRQGEVTSQAGWAQDVATRAALLPVVRDLKQAGVRVGVFVEAEPDAVRWAAELGADRVELYTGLFAQAYARSRDEGARVFEAHVEAAQAAHAAGLGVNAGHDLDLHNLTLYATLPHLAEVSIGHALISQALFVGLDATVREYLRALQT